MHSLSDGCGHLAVPIIDIIAATLLDDCVRHLPSGMSGAIVPVSVSLSMSFAVGSLFV